MSAYGYKRTLALTSPNDPKQTLDTSSSRAMNVKIPQELECGSACHLHNMQSDACQFRH